MSQRDEEIEAKVEEEFGKPQELVYDEAKIEEASGKLRELGYDEATIEGKLQELAYGEIKKKFGKPREEGNLLDGHDGEADDENAASSSDESDLESMSGEENDDTAVTVTANADLNPQDVKDCDEGQEIDKVSALRADLFVSSDDDDDDNTDDVASSQRILVEESEDEEAAATVYDDRTIIPESPAVCDFMDDDGPAKATDDNNESNTFEDQLDELEIPESPAVCDLMDDDSTQTIEGNDESNSAEDQLDILPAACDLIGDDTINEESNAVEEPNEFKGPESPVCGVYTATIAEESNAVEDPDELKAPESPAACDFMDGGSEKNIEDINDSSTVTEQQCESKEEAEAVVSNDSEDKAVEEEQREELMEKDAVVDSSVVDDHLSEVINDSTIDENAMETSSDLPKETNLEMGEDDVYSVGFLEPSSPIRTYTSFKRKSHLNKEENPAAKRAKVTKTAKTEKTPKTGKTTKTNAKKNNSPTGKSQKKAKVSTPSDETLYTVEKIVKTRDCKERSNDPDKRKRFEYFIKWDGYEMKDCTWEPYENIVNCQEILDEFFGGETAAKSRKGRKN